MTTLQSKVDAVKAAAGSTATCTSTTTVLLKELLATEAEAQSTAQKKKVATTTRGKATGTARGAATASKKEELTTKEKAALAAHIINVALKSLTEASKPALPTQPSTPCRRQNSGDDLRKPQNKRPLRRSNSMPMTPMQPRSLNRTSTSPTTTPKPTKSATTTIPTVTCLATVECLRAAFACLRSLHTSGAVQLPDLQLESGISSFVGKLVGLDLQEHALRELTLLRQRIDAMAPSAKPKTKAAKTTAASTKVKGLAEILDFGDAKFSGPTLCLVITTQMQILRLMSANKKPATIEAALPFLVPSHPTSPINLLLESAKESPSAKTKAARQLDLLSQLLLSLAPSLASKDDDVAVDCRLSCTPATALELQTLGLEARLHWWHMAGHKADVDKDIISPLSRCITSYIRRVKSDSAGAYRKSLNAFDRIITMVKSQCLEPKVASKSPLVVIYQALGTVAQTARHFTEAAEWISKIKATLDPVNDSPAKRCAVAAQLVAVYGKQTPLPLESLSAYLKEVYDALQGTLKGDVTELEELMVNLSAARRSAVGILAGKLTDKSQSLDKLLNDLVLQFPRFALRWLGKQPTKDASPKDHVRYESRKQLLLSSITQILDSALMVAKSQLDDNKMTWTVLDGLLQECLILLDLVGDASIALSKADASNLYHVKLSHLYFMFFNWYRRHAESKPGDKTPLRALRRSVDCVKDRSSEEKEKAQTTAKLEYFADLCKQAGRVNDARDALKLICTNMVEDGVLSTVAASLAESSPAVAWSASVKAETLSRTIGTMVKLDQSWNDWTFFLADVERAAVLERIIQLILFNTSSDPKPNDIKDPVTEALLRIYAPDRFPVHRLRTLLQLLTMSIGDKGEFQSLREQAEAALQLCRDGNFGDDAGLAGYVSDLEAGLSSTLALVATETEWRTADFEESTSIWRSIVNQCQTKNDLLSKVSDTEGLIRQLNSIAEYARLRGEDEFLLSVLTLCADIASKLSDSSTDLLLQAQSNLADQYTHLGYSEKAEEILNKAKKLAEASATNPDLGAVNLQISLSEYQLANQNSDAAHKMLLQGEISFENSSSVRKAPRLQRKLLLARAASLSSRINWDKGEYQHALFHAKTSVRILFQDWTKLEARWKDVPKAESKQTSREGSPDAEESLVSTGISTNLIELSDGPDSWALACGLLRAMLHLSSVYAHLGMFQETVYYAEKAHQVANATNASIYRAQAASWIGSVWLKACKLDKSLGYLNEARQLMATAVKPTRQAFQLACELSASFGEMKDHENEHLLLELAEVTLGTLNNSNRGAITGVNDEQVVSKMAKLTLKAPAARRTRVTKPADPAATRATRVTKRVAAPRTKAAAAAAAPKASVIAANESASDLKASMLLYKALVHLSKGDWAAAAELLEEAKQISSSLRESLRVQIGEATCLIEQGIKQMEGDSVFSVVKESTISYPSIHAATDKNNTEKTQPTASSPRKAQGRATSAERKVMRENATFVETLEQAQAQLMEAQAAAAISGNGHLVHRISALLQSTGIFLSAASHRTPKHMGGFGYAACSVEFARNLTWKRERNTVATDHLNASFSEAGWPLALTLKDDRRASIVTVDDMAKFQRDYIDIIPEAWSVLSIALSDNRKDLCITKLQSGQSPFVLRLPLERVASRDGEDELFDFQHGHDELMDIIQATNASCHNTGDYTAKGAKSAWWAQRENLDNRFKDLLDNVEQVWLGGFKGIFSQHRHRADLIAKFQKAFSKILDKHLPSRRQVRGKKTSKSPKITLEPRILDLFVGLGDPSMPDSDLEEPLNDLLYFVVDILQFHGERNAYDEIDFDSMVLDTFDALQAYHNAAKTSEPEEGAHSILILDKALHAFPWESLPCTEGLAYSRVPSLSCLRRLLLEQREARDSDDEKAHHRHTVSPVGGTYILNPGSDLKNTLATFEKPLKEKLCESWTGIVSRTPTEDEFEGALKKSDILLYFGHGSGAQYIRGKTIRRLEKCKAAALLMGCSSASLQNVGEYECHGPVWNYMLAGCPAVVGTLWDVTDRDIDRYAGRLFEEWGLMERGTFIEDSSKKKGKGKGLFATEKKSKAKKETTKATGRGNASLVEAVARARDACRFRYITAGAVCVYGIPVYIGKDKAEGA